MQHTIQEKNPFFLNSERKSSLETVYFKTIKKDKPIPVYFCIKGVIDNNIEQKQTVGASGKFTLYPYIPPLGH